MAKHVQKQYSINTSLDINENLRILRYKTNMNNAAILSQIITPLAEKLGNQEKPCGFIVYTVNDQIIIQTYGFGSIVCSGKATATLSDILGVA